MHVQRKRPLSGAVSSLTTNGWLIWELTKRELTQRYRGTILGILWPVLYAVMFLSVFAFVFSVLLKVRWGGDPSVRSGTLMIFCGLVPYLFLAEIIGRGPSLVLSAQGLVKRVRFPVHLIPVVAVNGTMLITLVNTVLLFTFAIFTASAPLIALPILLALLVPLYLLALALAWLFSSATVFFRDLTQMSPILAQLMMFLAPIFYPRDIVPDAYAPIMALNPLTYFVVAFRDALSGGFDSGAYVLALFGYALFAALAFIFFTRLRPAFGDVL